MYSTDPIWQRYYILRKLALFLKQYTSSLLFKVTSPLSSVFWIISSIVPEAWALSIKLIAVFTLLAPAIYFFIRFRPFNVKVDWEQLYPKGNLAARANHRDHIYVGENGGNVEIRVTVLFDPSVDSYSIQFDSDYPLEAYPGAGRPDNSDYDEETNTLSAKEADNVRFFFTLKVDAKRDLNVYDPQIRIIDTNNYNMGVFERLPDFLLKHLKTDTTMVKFSIY